MVDTGVAIQAGLDLAVGAMMVTFLASRAIGPRRHQRIVWRFRLSALERPKIIIENIQGAQTKHYRRPSTGFGVVVAVAQITEALNASRSCVVNRTRRLSRRPVEVSVSSATLADGWCSTADTVLVGGPKNNRNTRDVLRSYGCEPRTDDAVRAALVDDVTRRRALDRLLAETEARRGGGVTTGLGVATLDNTVVWFGKAFEGSVSEVHAHEPTFAFEGDDYGVILRLPSPTNPARRMVVVFGSQTFGVEAAAAWLVESLGRRARRTARSTTERPGPSPGAGPADPASSSPVMSRREIRRRLAAHPNVAVLVRASVRDGILSRPVLVELVALPDQLTPGHLGDDQNPVKPSAESEMAID